MATVSQPIGPLGNLAEADAAASALAGELAAVRTEGRTPRQVEYQQRRIRRRYIRTHLKAAGVDLGRYDEGIVQWLSRQEEVRFIVTVLGWVLRSKGVNR